MPAVHRQGDKGSSHPCHYLSTIAIGGSQNVFINGRPAMRVSDQYLPHACTSCYAGQAAGPHSPVIKQGSSSVLINNLAAARVGDTTSCGGVAEQGSPDVIFG